MIRRLAALALLAAAGCGDPCAGWRDLEASPGGLALTEDEHPAGWGQAGCFQCHVAATLHQGACGGDDVDLEAVRALADPEDTRSCTPCHGTNGVAEDTGP